MNAEPAVAFGDITLIPLVELSWQTVLDERGAGLTAAKSPLAVVVRFSDSIRAFRTDGQEIRLSELKGIPGLEELGPDP